MATPHGAAAPLTPSLHFGEAPAPKYPAFPQGEEGRSVSGDLNVTLRTKARLVRCAVALGAEHRCGLWPWKASSSWKALWDTWDERCIRNAQDYQYLFNLFFNRLLAWGKDLVDVSFSLWTGRSSAEHLLRYGGTCSLPERGTRGARATLCIPLIQRWHLVLGWCLRVGGRRSWCGALCPFSAPIPFLFASLVKTGELSFNHSRASLDH